jgi:acyl carrier protein
MSPTIGIIKEVVAQLRAAPTLAGELSDSADLIEDIALDSIELLQFMLEIEARMAISIDFEKLEYSYLNSIRTLADFLDTMPARQA